MDDVSPPGAATRFKRWITCPSPNPSARLRLFCLPFAGGGASVFSTWGRALPRTVELCPVQLPGRESRLGDAPCTDMRTLTSHLAREILPYTDKPFALFGHSMGALTTFELARTLRRLDAPMPTTLLLSAHRAAHLPPRRRPLHELADAEFLQAVQGFGGTPQEAFADRELVDLILPTLRADFAVCDSYEFTAEAPLPCPFVLYAGSQDPEVSPQDVAAWSEHTTKGARLQMFPGDHFFLRSDRDLLLQAIASDLA